MNLIIIILIVAFLFGYSLDKIDESLSEATDINDYDGLITKFLKLTYYLIIIIVTIAMTPIFICGDLGQRLKHFTDIRQ